MPTLTVGKKAPDFELPAADGSVFRLSDHEGTPVVLFFYPQDDTEGCTLENQEFSALLPEFQAIGAVVAGISPDTIESHCKFRDKFGLAAPLLADVGEKVTRKYGLWQLKKLWGVEYMGLVRTSFLIDSKGKIAGIYKATRIRDHAAKVLEAAWALSA
jgi:peroxiredoxin Q/BCP